jgi:hypothetical protein
MRIGASFMMSVQKRAELRFCGSVDPAFRTEHSPMFDPNFEQRRPSNSAAQWASGLIVLAGLIAYVMYASAHRMAGEAASQPSPLKGTAADKAR